MLTDNDLDLYTDEEIRAGEALCWVIDEHVLYDINLSKEHAEIFLSADTVLDISENYPTHNGITVAFYKNNELLLEFQTSEYFGSILLSQPIVVNLLNHKNGRYVISPNAKFINYEFVILNREILDTGWYPGKEPLDGKLAKCYSNCNCGWSDNV